MLWPDWRYDIGKRIFRGLFELGPVTQIPFVGKWVHEELFDEEDCGKIIPVNKSIEQADDVVLPSEIVRHLIEVSSHRLIMHKCICRVGENCEKYPADLGCIFLGEATTAINPSLGKLVSTDRALDHLDKCEEAGLVHLIGRFKFDATLLNAKPASRLLSICNCCECCCIFRLIPDLYEPIGKTISKLEGVEVQVNDKCKSCGLCLDACFVNAISLSEQGAVISDMCRGCGRCVRTCPNKAITLTIEKTDLFNETIKHFSKLVKI